MQCVVLADTMVWLVFMLAVVVMGDDDTIADIVTDINDDTIADIVTDINDDTIDDIVTDINDDNTTYEALPAAEEWRNAPSCPLWGPMDSFYKEGIEKGRVGDVVDDEIHQHGHVRHLPLTVLFY